MIRHSKRRVRTKLRRAPPLPPPRRRQRRPKRPWRIALVRHVPLIYFGSHIPLFLCIETRPCRGRTENPTRATQTQESRGNARTGCKRCQETRRTTNVLTQGPAGGAESRRRCPRFVIWLVFANGKLIERRRCCSACLGKESFS